MPTVTVRGLPAPKGSMKCVGGVGGVRHQLLPSNGPALDEWTRVVQLAAAQLGITYPAGMSVELRVEFTLPRPRSHHRTGRNSHLLKRSAPWSPTGHNTGDLDKLVRAIGDALQAAGVLHDDAQITTLACRKMYPDHALALPHTGARITVWADLT